MKLTSALQEALLALLCYDKAASSVVALTVTPRSFDPFYADIAEQAVSYASKYHSPPQDHTLDIIDTLKTRFPHNADFYDRIYASLQETKRGINTEYVLERMHAWAAYQKMTRGIKKAVDVLKRNDDSCVVEAASVLSESITKTGESFDFGTKLTDTARSLAFLDAKQAAFLTGIGPLDDRQLGPARKRLHLFAASPGKGKSWWLIHQAKVALISGLKVLYVSLELAEEEVMQRVCQAIFSIPKRRGAVAVSRFKQDELGRFISFEQEQVDRGVALADAHIREFLSKKIGSLRMPPFIVKQFPTGSLTLQQLDAYLDALEAVEGFMPDLLIIDYADLMAVDSKNYRTDLGLVYKRLRGLAIERNIAVATASQANREAASLKVITIENLAEDYSKAATADVVITYNQTQAEHGLSLARLFVAKGRTDEDRFTVVISQAYRLGQFCLDTVGFVSSYWDRLRTDDPGEEADS